MNKNKKLFFILLAMVIVVTFLFARELRRSFNIVTKQSNQPIVSDGTADIPVDKTDYVLGNPGAALNIIMFGDFSCAQCRAVYTKVAAAVRAHPTDMRLIWKSAPLGGIFTQGNFLPHQAAWCAGKQNQFWAFAEMAMADKHNLTEDGLKKIAEGLKLNTTVWWQCTNSEEAKKKIANGVETVNALGLKSVPALFVNNKLVNTDANIDLENLLVSFVKK